MKMPATYFLCATARLVNSKVEKQRTLSAVDYMLDRADFCICNLQSTLGDALRNRIAASNGAAVFDIAGNDGEV